MSSQPSRAIGLSPTPWTLFNTQDILTSEEFEIYSDYSDTVLRFETLKALGGESIKIPENFLFELADVVKCNQEMEVLKYCLQKHKTLHDGKI